MNPLIAETLSFLDINKFQDHSGRIALLDFCEHKKQVLTHWIRNTNYQIKTKAFGSNHWTSRIRNGISHSSNNYPTEYCGNNRIWKKLGVPHRENDLPACEWAKRKEWMWQGKLHREGDRPAVEIFGVEKEWWSHGVLHRLHGQAVVYEALGGYANRKSGLTNEYSYFGRNPLLP